MNVDDAMERMVSTQIETRGIKDKKVLEVMRRVDRRPFVPPVNRHEAYEDKPLPIGYNQTISQPYIVALMAALLELEPDDKILEIGAGSGYLTAILSLLSKEVYSLEIVPELAHTARTTLYELGFKNVNICTKDGYYGWPELAPFEKIVLSAAPKEIPAPLIEQLKNKGKLVSPIGPQEKQILTVISKTASGYTKRDEIPVRFVPMTGQIQKEDK